jgi:hypothetical protein
LMYAATLVDMAGSKLLKAQAAWQLSTDSIRPILTGGSVPVSGPLVVTPGTGNAMTRNTYRVGNGVMRKRIKRQTDRKLTVLDTLRSKRDRLPVPLEAEVYQGRIRVP